MTLCKPIHLATSDVRKPLVDTKMRGEREFLRIEVAVAGACIQHTGKDSRWHHLLVLHLLPPFPHRSKID